MRHYPDTEMQPAPDYGRPEDSPSTDDDPEYARLLLVAASQPPGYDPDEIRRLWGSFFREEDAPPTGARLLAERVKSCRKRALRAAHDE